MFGLQYSLAARCLPSGIRSVEAGVVRLSGEIPLLTRLTARDLTCNMPDSRMGVIYASPDSGIRAASTASHRLPNELLAEIFQLGHRGYDVSDNAVIRHLSAISSVCCIWRDVALNEPSLWTNIIYVEKENFRDSSPTSNDLPPATEERIASYLSRSRNSALAIRLVFRRRGRGLMQLQNMIYPHLSHCCNIDLHFSFSCHAFQLFPLPPHLNRLAVFRCAVRGPGAQLSPLVLFSESDRRPRLQKLTLSMRDGLINLLTLASIDVGHLTTLQLSGMSEMWRDAIAFVSRCHSLRNLNLAVPPERLQEPFPPFTLPELRCLQAYGLEFTLAIHTPNLQSLTIFEALDGSLLDHIPPVPPTLSFPSLRILRFMEADVMRPEIQAFLQSNPTIEVLEFWACVVGSEDSEEFDQVSEDYDVVNAMSDEDGEAFLPSLKLIQLSDCGRMRFYGSVIEWLFNSRPELRCDETLGGRVSPDLAALIHDFPADQDYFYW